MVLEVDGEAALHPGVLDVTPHDGGAGRRAGARQGREQILTEECYERGPSRRTDGDEIMAAAAPAYFVALEQLRTVAAFDALSGPTRAGLTAGHRLVYTRPYEAALD